MPEATIQATIVKRQDQGRGVAILDMAAHDGSPLPGFFAGAHIEVHINDTLARNYSLSNAPSGKEDASSYRIGVLNDPESRGGSAAIFESFNVGREVTISAPRNLFELDEGTDTAVLVAGGIGITPILAMAYQLRSQQRPFEIHYCLSSMGVGAFVDELQSVFPDELTMYCSDVAKFDPVTTFASMDTNSHIYVCGPEGFMNWIIDAAKGRGFAESNIHFEYFNVEVDTGGEAFEVFCSESELTVQVGAQDTIAGALKNAGVSVDVSCEQGICGTCISELLEGEADHRDQFLTDEEKEDNDQIALCCSRAKSSRLVIEI